MAKICGEPMPGEQAISLGYDPGLYVPRCHLPPTHMRDHRAMVRGPRGTAATWPMTETEIREHAQRSSRTPLARYTDNELIRECERRGWNVRTIIDEPDAP